MASRTCDVATLPGAVVVGGPVLGIRIGGLDSVAFNVGGFGGLLAKVPLRGQHRLPCLLLCGATGRFGLRLRVFVRSNVRAGSWEVTGGHARRREMKEPRRFF